MVDGKEEKTLAEQPITEEPKEPKIPTQEEINDLIAQAKEEAKREVLDPNSPEYQEAHKGMQRKLDQRDKELERVKREKSSPSASSTMKVLLEKLAKSRDYSDDPETKAEVGNLLSQLGQEERATAQQTIIAQKREELTQKITEAGLDPTDEQFDRVWDAYREATRWDGDFGEAERRLGRVISKVVKTEPLKQEQKVDLSKLTDEELEILIPRERLEKISRDSLEKEGKIKQSKGSPSGSGETFQELEAKFIAGDTSVQDRYNEERRKRRL